MLESLTVKNFALIKEADVEFTKGLNILTGETGAGKSVVIGSIALTLGEKAVSDIIREGAEYAFSELVFHVEDEKLVSAIKDLDMPIEEDGTIILSRKLQPGRSVIKVCGETVTLKQMRELSSLLIDIHGQHEHQSLLKESRQKELLDLYCGADMEKLLAEIKKAYTAYNGTCSRLEELSVDDASRQREISLAEYEINEIEAANIVLGEEAELEQRYRKMKNSGAVFEILGKVREALAPDGEGAVEYAGRAVHDMNAALALDEGLSGIAGELADCEDMLRTVARELDDYMEDSEFDEALFKETEERMDVLNHLMSKYGGSTEKIIEYLEKRRAEYDEYKNLDAVLEKLGRQKDEAEQKLKKLCNKAHDLRVKQGLLLEKEITAALTDLNFLKVSFTIEVTERENYSSDGNDDVRFMISLNPGEKKRPLSEVASGGELSRIMLALKAVLADKDEIGTLIFDEIDTGISGKTAWMVSEKMAAIAKSHQTICITHLPQIAAMADTHFCIEKSEVDGRTETNIDRLDEAQSLNELARLLGGGSITETAIANAQELKSEAERVKLAL